MYKTNFINIQFRKKKTQKYAKNNHILFIKLAYRKKRF